MKSNTQAPKRDPEEAFLRIPNENQEQLSCEACSQGMNDDDDRFDDFDSIKISSPIHGAFVAGRQFHKKKLSSPSKIIQDLKSYSFRAEFKKAQQVHLKSHHQIQSFYKTSHKHVKGLQVLHYIWMFVYKTDKHGFLQKCKVWLVICENQQAPEDLPTRATILASMTFHALMAITAKFNLETIQLNAVNTFVNCELNEMVYMKQPPGFEIDQNTVLQL